MPSRIWSHLCSYATYDAWGRVTIIEEIDTLMVPQLPWQLPTLFFVSKWEGAPGEQWTLQHRMVNAGDKYAGWDPGYFFVGPLENFTTGKNYEGVQPVSLFTLALGSMFATTFTAYGDYPMEFLVNGNIAHVMPFRVVPWIR